MLQAIRTAGNTIVDPAKDKVLEVGAPSLLDTLGSLSGRINLHSISLLHALCLSEDFRNAVAARRNALEIFFDPGLYAQDLATSDAPDFLTRLLKQHVGNAATNRSPNDVLDTLAADMLRIGSSGTASGENVNKALLAALTEHYQFGAQPRALFTAASGGIHFNTADLRSDLSNSKALPRLTTAVRSLAPRDKDLLAEVGSQQSWHIQSGDGAMTWSDGASADDLAIGGSGGDTLQGGAGKDILLGLDGADMLEGGAGNDTLIGGAGLDTYIVGNGNDTLSDDLAGEGVIRTESGITLAGGKGAGKRNTWVGANDEIYTFVPTRAAQLGTLTITHTGAGNDVTIEHFDLAQAQANGYLGIRLDPTPRIVLEEAGGTNPFGACAFDVATVAGLTTIAEGVGRAFTIYLSAAARAGDTIALALSGLGEDFKALIGGIPVAAHGAVITLAEGQTQASFGLVQAGEVAADLSGSLSARYASQGATAASNVWTLDVEDAGATTRTLDGDQTYATYTASTDIWRDGRIVVNRGESAFVVGQDGNLVPGADLAAVDNTLYGSGANDRIEGLFGNDALNGGAGNDRLEGGEGDDLIAGGAGNNDLRGGAGNDFILGAGNLGRRLQQLGPNDTWQAPVGKFVYGHGTTWGVYRDSDILTIWDGAADAGLGTAGSTIDAGDGDDRVIGGRGDDHVQGGAGNDVLDGAGGADIIEGGDGNDRIQADGVIAEGYLNTVAAENHGADLVDGGAGDDDIEGGGNADVLFGGPGADRIFGDRGGRTDDPFFVKLEAHGADTLDGEDGNDFLEGGGNDDTIYGGAGNDYLWGDTSAANIVGNAAGQSAADLGVLAYGNDYLDGEDGNDTMVGGGRDDTLYGGTGNDRLWGDDSGAALLGEYNGIDYLDGGEGDDQLVGGGNADALYGGDGADRLFGDDSQDKVAGAFHGNDYLDGGAGNDVLVGGGRHDTLFGGDGADTLVGDTTSTSELAAEFHGNDYLDGGNGDDALAGGGEDDTLIGGQGNDYLDGGSGADYLEGGAGDDIYIVDDAGDIVAEAAGEGDDGIISSISIFLPDNIERLTLTGTEATGATGNDGDNTLCSSDGANRLIGMGGNDTLIGGGGADTLVGGTGDDYYEVDNAGDTIVELAGQGDDLVRTMVSYTLAENVERLAADGTAGIGLTGNTQGNSLVGNSGNNVLAGGEGNDHLVGAAGNDVYVFNRGDGQDAIDNSDLLGATDTLRFGAGIADADVVAFRSGNNLILRLKGASDLVSVLDYYGPNTGNGGAISDHKIDGVEFSNGVVWDQAMIQAAVDRAASNHAPTVNSPLPTLQARAGDAFAYTVPVGAITDPDPGDSIVYSVNMPDGTAVPSWLGFDPATRTFTGTPQADNVGSLQLVLWGTDNYGVGSGESVTLNVAGPNRAPVLATALPDQAAWQGGAFTFTLPSTAFADPDVGDTLSLSATLADGSTLPSWLDFDPTTRVFSGTPSSPGITSVRVTASDRGNLTASDVFDIAVADGLTINGTNVSDFLDGGPGSDALNGFDGDDHLFGYAGNDRLDGGAGNDSLDGGGGSDTYVFGKGSGQDTIHNFDYNYVPGVPKTDVIEFSAGVAVSDVRATRDRSNHLYLTITSTGDRLMVWGYFSKDFVSSDGLNSYEVERIRFTDGTVWDAATVAALARVPTAGDDVLIGADGNDVLDGGAGNDYLEGGAGADTYRFGKGYGTDAIYDYDTTGVPGSDVIELAAGVTASDVKATRRNGYALVLTIVSTGDELTVEEYFAEYAGGTSNSSIEEIRFADGTLWDVATVKALVTAGTAGDDQLYGYDATNDVLDGGPGDDSLNGMGGNDTLYGGGGNDSLYGGDGNDVLDGGAGDDHLSGDKGNDTYIFGKGSGQDVLFNVDFDPNKLDVIRLASNVTVAEVTAKRSGDALILTIGTTGDTLHVRDFFRVDDGLRCYKVEQIQFAAEITLGVEADLILGKTGVGHESFAQIEGGDQARAGFFRDLDAIADMVGMAVGNQDEIGLVDLGQVILAVFIRWIGDPGIDQQDFSVRGLELECGMAVPSELGLACGKRCGRQQA